MAAIKYAVDIDLSGYQLLNVVLQVLSAAPANPTAGRIYYDTTLSTVRCYDGTAWVAFGAALTNALTLNNQGGAYYLSRVNHTGTQVASTISDLAAAVQAYRLDQFATPTTSVNMSSQRVINVANPTNAQDAATQSYVLTQISNLVNGAGGALDTLNELAAALGNDPNFATSVATSIADAKARANHTGTQLASTISDFNTAVLAAIGVAAYGITIGDGTAASFTLTHNLGTYDVVVEIFEAAGNRETVYSQVRRPSVNTLNVAFNVAPTASQYRVVVRKAA